jgi:hypothetical protein
MLGIKNVKKIKFKNDYLICNLQTNITINRTKNKRKIY